VQPEVTLSKKLRKKSNKEKRVTNSGSPMDVGLLEQIVKLMAANDLNTVDVRDGAQRVILKRGALASAGASPGFFTTMHAAPAPTAASSSSASGSASPSAARVDEGLIPIKSPMVGTFYSASSPDAKPFVQVGSTVDEETDVCIIEAMKVFNNIKAECRGTITKILVTNGQTVEFGQELFLVKPA
jgi:acetyl-CoA carboxylase biotin carboxyl carrier protein